jgi:hypothetical protein
LDQNTTMGSPAWTGMGGVDEWDPEPARTKEMPPGIQSDSNPPPQKRSKRHENSRTRLMMRGACERQNANESRMLHTGSQLHAAARPHAPSGWSLGDILCRRLGGRWTSASPELSQVLPFSCVLAQRAMRGCDGRPDGCPVSCSDRSVDVVGARSSFGTPPSLLRQHCAHEDARCPAHPMSPRRNCSCVPGPGLFGVPWAWVRLGSLRGLSFGAAWDGLASPSGPFFSAVWGWERRRVMMGEGWGWDGMGCGMAG